MPSVNVGTHFKEFIDRQIATGRFQNASEVVRAGLRLLEDHEAAQRQTRARVAEGINAAFDDPGEDIPADEVFGRLQRHMRADQEAGKRGV